MHDTVHMIIYLFAYLLSPVKRRLEDRAVLLIFVSPAALLVVCAQ